MKERELQLGHRQYSKRIMMESIADAEAILQESGYEPKEAPDALTTVAAALFTARVRPYFYYKRDAKDREFARTLDRNISNEVL